MLTRDSSATDLNFVTWIVTQLVNLDRRGIVVTTDAMPPVFFGVPNFVPALGKSWSSFVAPCRDLCEVTALQRRSK